MRWRRRTGECAKRSTAPGRVRPIPRPASTASCPPSTWPARTRQSQSGCMTGSPKPTSPPSNNSSATPQAPGSTSSATPRRREPRAAPQRRHVARLRARARAHRPGPRRATRGGPRDVPGVLTAAGGIYEADMVIDALLSGGGSIGAVHAALDFGCSSGRVLRSLTAAYPAIEWHGCDPNGPAIEWATANLPGRASSSTATSRRCHSLRARSTSPTRSRSGRTSSPPAGCSGSRRCAGSSSQGATS